MGADIRIPPAHATLFLQPPSVGPELFGKKCFLRFYMIQDGGVNETANCLISSLSGPTLVFMLYATVSSFRTRVAQGGNYSLAILESLGFWIFLDAAGGGSFHCDRLRGDFFFAYRAFGIGMQAGEESRGKQRRRRRMHHPTSRMAVWRPYNLPCALAPRAGRGCSSPLLLSAAYIGIASAACLFAWASFGCRPLLVECALSPTPSTALFPVGANAKKEGHTKKKKSTFVSTGYTPRLKTKPDHEKKIEWRSWPLPCFPSAYMSLCRSNPAWARALQAG